MFNPIFRTYIRAIFTHIPWTHWIVIGLLSLIGTLLHLYYKKDFVYSAILFGFIVFTSLLILDTSIVIRLLGILPHTSGFDFVAEYNRLFHGNKAQHYQILFNLFAFVPLGLFMSEYLSEMKQLNVKRIIYVLITISFAISLCIECLQLILRVGIFEITDLVTNTTGALVGTSLAMLERKMFRKNKKEAK